jgi:type I restriction enzyme, S subunit
MKRLMQSKMPIASVAKVISGYAFKSSEFRDQGIPVIKIKNIRTGNIDFSDTEYVSDQYLSIDSKYHVRSEDILISLTGSHVNQPNSVVGRVARYPRGLGIALLNQRAGKVIIKDPDRCDKSFLYYHLFDEQTRREIAALAHGAANQANVSPSQIESIKINLPSHADQKKIGVVLSAYDDLIENNCRRIKTLEEMAQTLYQECFVKFRFPGNQKVKMVNSPLGKIPEGWEVLNVENIVKRHPPGKLYEQKTVYAEGTVPVLDQGRSGVIGYHNDSPGVEANEENPVIIFANHTCYQRIIHFPFSAIQNVIPFYPNPDHYRNIYWLHYATKDLISFNDYKGHWPEYMGKKVVVPTIQVAEDFGSHIKPNILLVFVLQKKCKNLSQTRDLLLPKLISGKLDVSELDITISEANV